MSREELFQQEPDATVKTDIQFPIYLRNSKKNWYLCLDDKYRYMLCSKNKTGVHANWTYSFGLNYGYGVEEYNEKQENLEHYFAKRLMSLNEVITKEEFFDNLSLFDKHYQEYQNFFMVNRPENQVQDEVYGGYDEVKVEIGNMPF